MTDAPTYEELRTLRAQEWRDAQALAAQERDAQIKKISAMPDVMPPDSPYSHTDIACGCGGQSFQVLRWVTVNGMKHRAEFQCLACAKVGTWGWMEQRWIA